MSQNPQDPARDPQDPTGTLDRRGDERQQAEARIKVRLDTTEFGGNSKNISPAGVFFFSDNLLRVTVEFDDGEGHHVAKGSLVRVERMDAQTTGFAIEFDQ